MAHFIPRGNPVTTIGRDANPVLFPLPSNTHLQTAHTHTHTNMCTHACILTHKYAHLRMSVLADTDGVHVHDQCVYMGWQQRQSLSDTHTNTYRVHVHDHCVYRLAAKTISLSHTHTHTHTGFMSMTIVYIGWQQRQSLSLSYTHTHMQGSCP